MAELDLHLRLARHHASARTAGRVRRVPSERRPTGHHRRLGVPGKALLDDNVEPVAADRDVDLVHLDQLAHVLGVGVELEAERLALAAADDVRDAGDALLVVVAVHHQALDPPHPDVAAAVVRHHDVQAQTVAHADLAGNNSVRSDF